MALTSYNGITVPGFMYGTAWKKEATADLVRLAVRSGFRAIDTANQIIHYHEALVGEALRSLPDEGTARESLFLQTKFTSAGGQDHRTPYDPNAPYAVQVTQSFQSSLDHLGTDYVDSYVLHAPLARRGLSEGDWEIWNAMEALYREGKTKMLGVSNISAEQLQGLCARAQSKPMMVQNRCFAALGWDKAVREICRAERILYQGFSLLTANTEFITGPEFRAIARSHGAGLAQVVFRFAMQAGMLPLTGTTSEQHMKEDLASDRFTLTDEEMRTIESIAVR